MRAPVGLVWIRLIVDPDPVRAEAIGVGFRLPVSCPIPLSLAAELIGVPPDACVVYEDGEMGIVAAQRAGMEVIDVRPWYLPRK